MTYVIDIDGTICRLSDNDPTYTQSLPFPERIEKINNLYNSGHTIIYHTARGMGRYKNNPQLANQKFYSLTKSQLEKWGCKYHLLFLGKPSGDFYIDDKAVKDEDFFTN
tara:strand:- start:594 stop:920 length:327 start_codon:yes stop_codon:yes gene_type:complete